jgi:hypothetical protein
MKNLALSHCYKKSSASSQSCYTEFSGAQVAHSRSLLSASEDEDDDDDDDDDDGNSEHSRPH